MTNAWKIAGAIASLAVTLGTAASSLPDGRVKHALMTAGAIAGMLSALFAKPPQLRPSVTMRPPALVPGDVLLYRPVGIFGLAIAVKTWHPIAHVEVFIGNGESIASRDGLGTGRYALRLSELAVVCRPNQPIDVPAAVKAFDAKPHRPYGWWDLLNFVGLAWSDGGIVCSPCATEVVRDYGLKKIFNGEAAASIAPFQFEESECFDIYDVSGDGTLQRRG